MAQLTRLRHLDGEHERHDHQQHREQLGHVERDFNSHYAFVVF